MRPQRMMRKSAASRALNLSNELITKSSLPYCLESVGSTQTFVASSASGAFHASRSLMNRKLTDYSTSGRRYLLNERNTFVYKEMEHIYSEREKLGTQGVRRSHEIVKIVASHAFTAGDGPCREISKLLRQAQGKGTKLPTKAERSHVATPSPVDNNLANLYRISEEDVDALFAHEITPWSLVLAISNAVSTELFFGGNVPTVVSSAGVVPEEDSSYHSTPLEQKQAAAVLIEWVKEYLDEMVVEIRQVTEAEEQKLQKIATEKQLDSVIAVPMANEAEVSQTIIKRMTNVINTLANLQLSPITLFNSSDKQRATAYFSAGFSKVSAAFLDSEALISAKLSDSTSTTLHQRSLSVLSFNGGDNKDSNLLKRTSLQDKQVGLLYEKILQFFFRSLSSPQIISALTAKTLSANVQLYRYLISSILSGCGLKSSGIDRTTLLTIVKRLLANGIAPNVLLSSSSVGTMRPQLSLDFVSIITDFSCRHSWKYLVPSSAEDQELIERQQENASASGTARRIVTKTTTKRSKASQPILLLPTISIETLTLFQREFAVEKQTTSALSKIQRMDLNTRLRLIAELILHGHPSEASNMARTHVLEMRFLLTERLNTQIQIPISEYCIECLEAMKAISNIIGGYFTLIKKSSGLPGSENDPQTIHDPLSGPSEPLTSEASAAAYTRLVAVQERVREGLGDVINVYALFLHDLHSRLLMRARSSVASAIKIGNQRYSQDTELAKSLDISEQLEDIAKKIQPAVCAISGLILTVNLAPATIIQFRPLLTHAIQVTACDVERRQQQLFRSLTAESTTMPVSVTDEKVQQMSAADVSDWLLGCVQFLSGGINDMMVDLTLVTLNNGTPLLCTKPTLTKNNVDVPIVPRHSGRNFLSDLVSNGLVKTYFHLTASHGAGSTTITQQFISDQTSGDQARKLFGFNNAMTGQQDRRSNIEVGQSLQFEEDEESHKIVTNEKSIMAEVAHYSKADRDAEMNAIRQRTLSTLSSHAIFGLIVSLSKMESMMPKDAEAQQMQKFKKLLLPVFAKKLGETTKPGEQFTSKSSKASAKSSKTKKDVSQQVAESDILLRILTLTEGLKSLAIASIGVFVDKSEYIEVPKTLANDKDKDVKKKSRQISITDVLLHQACATLTSTIIEPALQSIHENPSTEFSATVGVMIGELLKTLAVMGEAKLQRDALVPTQEVEDKAEMPWRENLIKALHLYSTAPQSKSARAGSSGGSRAFFDSDINLLSYLFALRSVTNGAYDTYLGLGKLVHNLSRMNATPHDKLEESRSTIEWEWQDRFAVIKSITDFLSSSPETQTRFGMASVDPSSDEGALNNREIALDLYRLILTAPTLRVSTDRMSESKVLLSSEAAVILKALYVVYCEAIRVECAEENCTEQFPTPKIVLTKMEGICQAVFEQRRGLSPSEVSEMVEAISLCFPSNVKAVLGARSDMALSLVTTSVHKMNLLTLSDREIALAHNANQSARGLSSMAAVQKHERMKMFALTASEESRAKFISSFISTIINLRSNLSAQDCVRCLKALITANVQHSTCYGVLFQRMSEVHVLFDVETVVELVKCAAIAKENKNEALQKTCYVSAQPIIRQVIFAIIEANSEILLTSTGAHIMDAVSDVCPNDAVADQIISAFSKLLSTSEPTIETLKTILKLISTKINPDVASVDKIRKYVLANTLQHIRPLSDDSTSKSILDYKHKIDDIISIAYSLVKVGARDDEMFSQLKDAVVDRVDEITLEGITDLCALNAEVKLEDAETIEAALRYFFVSSPTQISNNADGLQVALAEIARQASKLPVHKVAQICMTAHSVFSIQSPSLEKSKQQQVISSVFAAMLPTVTSRVYQLSITDLRTVVASLTAIPASTPLVTTPVTVTDSAPLIKPAKGTKRAKGGKTPKMATTSTLTTPSTVPSHTTEENVKILSEKFLESAMGRLSKERFEDLDPSAAVLLLVPLMQLGVGFNLIEKLQTTLPDDEKQPLPEKDIEKVVAVSKLMDYVFRVRRIIYTRQVLYFQLKKAFEASPPAQKLHKPLYEFVMTAK